MRNFFTIIIGILFSSVMPLSIVACSNMFDDPNVYRITVVTDGHTITDHSFNESAYNAALLFKKQFDEWTHSNLSDPKYKNKHVEISWDNPQVTDLYNLTASYNKAAFINSKVVIASGFLHHDALVKSQNGTLKHKIKFVFVDGDTPNNEVPVQNKQLAGLLYKAEQSGFLAGLAGACFLAAHNSEYGGLNNLKMTTYGGVDIPAVTNYMYGYYWAIQLFNSNSSLIKDKLLAWTNQLVPQGQLPLVALPTIGFVTSGTQFSGNFTQGDKASQGINEALATAGSDIIFPVAGAQTEDTIAALQGTNGKIIGVDTDQQLQYPSFADRFITSAQKDIVNSVNYMLWRAIGRTDDDPIHPSDPTAEEIYNTNAPYRGGPGFTTIANNKPISVIYKSLTTDPDLINKGKLLDQVSMGWQKVLDIGKDYWINAIKAANNPFK